MTDTQQASSADDTYVSRLNRLLAAITDAPNLDAAQQSIEQHLVVVLDPRFLPAFLTHAAATRTTPIEGIALWLTQTALIEALQALPPQRLGPTGLALLLTFGMTLNDEGLFAFAERYGSMLDEAFFSHAGALADTLESQPDLPSGAKSAAARLRVVAQELATLKAMGGMAPPMQYLSVEDPPVFLESVVHQARQIPVWLLPFVDNIVQSCLKRNSVEQCSIALCAWALHKATDLLRELPNEDDATLGDVLRHQARRQAEEWVVQTAQDSRLQAAQAWAPLVNWLAEGRHPPKFHVVHRNLSYIQSEEDLWKLVEEEPGLFDPSVAENLRNAASISVTGGMGVTEHLTRIADWLESWRADLIQPEHNPVVRLAHLVQGGHLTLKETEAQLDFQGGLEIRHLAALDASIHAGRFPGSDESERLAWLNYAAAKVLGHDLMRGYAAYTLAFVLNERRPLSEVQSYLEEAINLGERLDHPFLQAQALDALSGMCATHGQIDKAIQYLDKAQDIIRRLPLSVGRSETLLSLASLQLQRNDLAGARRRLKLVEQYGTPEESSVHAGHYWFLLGELAWRQGEPGGATQAWDQAEAIAREIGHVSLLGEVARHRAMLALDHDSETAQRLLTEASLPTTAGERALHLSALAMLALYQGRYLEALERLREAWAEAEKLSNPERELAILVRLLALCLEMNLDEEAEELQERCEVLVTQVGRADVDVDVLLNRGFVLAMQGQHREALRIYRQVLRRVRQQDDARHRWDALYAISSCYLDLYKPDLALLVLRAAGPPPRPRSVIAVQSHQAAIWAQQAHRLAAKGQSDAPLVLFRQAERVWRNLADRTDVILGRRLSALENLGVLYQELEDPVQQAWAFRRGVELLEQQRLELSTEVVQKRFLSARSHFYEQAIETSVTADQPFAAVEIAEQMRARLLSSRLLRLEVVPSEYREKYRQVLQALEQAQNQWLGLGIARGDYSTPRALSLLEMERDPSDPGRERRKWDEARREFDEVMADIRHNYPDYAPLSLATPLTLADIQALLTDQPKTALVYLQGGLERTVALVVTAFGAGALSLPLVPGRVRDMVRRAKAYRDQAAVPSLSHRQPEFNPIAFAHTVDDISDELGRRLWADLHPCLEELGVEYLILLPDSSLALLPLHAAPLLPFGDSADSPTRYVLDRYTVTYAPSAQVLDVCMRRVQGHAEWTWTALAEGHIGGLALSAAVILALTKALRPGRLLWSSEASLDRLKTLAAEASILHFDVHGRFDADRPEAAALHLAWETGEGGRPQLRQVTLAEIQQVLTLKRNRLVTLAACEGGEVAMERVPEFVGLPAAFLIAGAPAVVAAPWRVEETATLLLLSRFYQYLAAELSIAESLRRAQIWLRDLSREEIIQELERLQAAVIASVGKLPQSELMKARTKIGGAIRQFREEGDVLARLAEEVVGLDREGATAVLDRAVDAYLPGTRENDKIETHLYDLLFELRLKMLLGVWDTPRLLDHVHRLLERPYASPYYWGGFQAVGAAL